MRKATRNVVGVISLGILATSWSIGQAAETGLNLAPANPAANPESAPAANPAPGETGAASPAPSSNSASSSAPAPATAKPSPTKTSTAVESPVTKTSAAIAYVAHRAQGTMQISVTKTGSKITDITILSGGTEGGDWASVPGVLADAALKSQGANFGNVGGATHTTDAFYKALESALAKF